ncbi:MAG: HAD-IC family P-type ATPase [Nitrososphaeria archaeon]
METDLSLGLRQDEVESRLEQYGYIARPKLHMEKVISKVLKWLLVIVVVLLCVATVFSLMKGINLLEILPLMLVLLLGAVPVALPVMFTVSMALGSMELVNKDVLVTRLNACEDAASMDILCVDKTGTITMNRLSIADVMPLGKYHEDEVILYGALDSQEANLDPIDLAFIDIAKQKKLPLDRFTQKSFIPFNPETRRTEALVQGSNSEFKVIKGAISAIAKICELKGNDLRKIEEKVNEFAHKGYRTIAVAKSNGNKSFELMGWWHSTTRLDPTLKSLLMS